ncbi:MAG: sensor histidine kinase [Cytophagaceae bacterium]
MKLKNEIAGILSLKSLVFVLACSLIYYFYVKRSITHQVRTHLESIAEHKQKNIESFLDKRLEELTLLKSLSVIEENLHFYHRSDEQTFLHPLSNAIEEYARTISNVKRIHVANLEKTIIASTDSSFIGKKKHQLQKNKPNPYSGFYILNGDPILKLSTNVSHAGSDVGYITVEYFARELKEIAIDYFGLGETGETIIITKNIKGTPIYLMPLRFHKHGQYKKINLKADEASEKAISGQEGFFDDVYDYRGERVLAITRIIPKINWGIVIKQDRREGLANLAIIQQMSMWLALAAIVILVITSFIFANYLVRPITNLINTAVSISQGDLSKRVTINRKNELGILANAFNLMTDKITLAKDDLEQKIKALNESNDSLNRFAYIVSHDLKAPLHSITALSDLFLSDKKEHLDEEGKMMLEMLKLKSDHMQQLIDGILQYSRIGNCAGDDELTDLTKITENVIQNLNENKNIKFITDKLPILLINKTCIMQVIQNLISNAVKYMDKPEGIIHIKYFAEEKYHTFTVADNGPGIPSKYHNTVFEIFNTGSQEKTADSTGVGLAIVKRIIESYNGKIWIESTPGEGTSFYFTLPINEKS